MEVSCIPPGFVLDRVKADLQLLRARQTSSKLIHEYNELSTSNRELNVRFHQLEKETSELREEIAHAHGQLEKCGGADTIEELTRLRLENGSLYKDKFRLLEELFSTRSEIAAERSRADKLAMELESASKSISELQSQIQQEVDARVAAASEVEGALAAKESAVAEAERLQVEKDNLMRKLVRIKEEEAERITQISMLHEEAMHEATRMKKEAAADLQAAQIIRSKLSGVHSLTKGPRIEQGDFESVGQISLKQTMGLGERGLSSVERVLPASPSRSTPAHKGGASGLSAAATGGNFIASCGQNQAVAVWDVTLNSLGAIKGAPATPVLLLHGHGSFSDVAFNSDGHLILAASMDRSISVWDSSSGSVRHTLTGHSAGVTGLSSSSSESSCTISIGEDRVLKVWDLNRGFCVRSYPVAKMPLNVVLCHDGSTAATGHTDGSILLWDVRSKDNTGSGQPNETRSHSVAICSLSRGSGGDSLICASRDNTISIIDLRGGGLSVTRTLRCPGFSLGLVGGIGKQRCKVDMSHDGRFITAGGMDGGVAAWELNLPASSPPLILRHHKEAVIATAWNSDTSVLASCDKGGVVALWDCMPA